MTEDTTASAVEKIRKLHSRLRTIYRNQRIGLYTGRNSASTSMAIGYHLGTIDKLMPTLPEHLQGLLRTEHELAERISEARDIWGPEAGARPELKARLNQTRREIKEAVNA